MQIHELRTIIKRKRRRRIGRGGKRGTYSGRGLKGQKSRAGRRIRPAMRDLIARLPKRRGVKHPPVRVKPRIVQLRDLAQFSGEVTPERLREKGLIPARHRGAVKIVGKGKLAAPLMIREIRVSKGAREAVERAGGKVIDRT
ncbi:MAG: uL15 family ribosomal protein [Candidatus Liptonbacteria bacterium]|nr:uL15 family ribosomal protein [Candidatus Liptonbacteria bacterium]